MSTAESKGSKELKESRTNPTTNSWTSLTSPPLELKLYHYWRSSSSWRVRWTLAYKEIPCEYVAIDLLTGESESPEHLARNPLGYVPVLEVSNPNPAKGNTESPWQLFESIAIIEWLEERFPKPSVLPGTPEHRARIRQLTEIINAGTQPLQNLNPQFLHAPDDAEARKKWAQHWIRNGLHAYETVVQSTASMFSVGEQLSLADFCLVPQCYNAARYDIDLSAYPTIQRIHQNALQTESYQASAPERFQP